MFNPRNILPHITLLPLILALVGCGDAEHSPPEEYRLFDPPLHIHWKPSGIHGESQFRMQDGTMVLPQGSPMSGAVFSDWVNLGLPLTHYAITYEAKRVAGDDFFGTVTFPVGKIDRCISFVLGGWGGAQVGLSSIDGLDAAQNVHGSTQPLGTGHWYQIRIEVRENLIQVWLDQRPIIRADIRGQQIHLRDGEIFKCAPFGFAAYTSEAHLRNAVVARLPRE